MGADTNLIQQKDRHRTVVAKFTKVVFPEICPVCMNEAEDLVALTMMETKERWTETRSLVGGWAKSQDRADVILEQARGGTTFWIPACLQHGSGSVTTPRKKTMSAIGFLFLLYPFIFYVLGIAAALEFSRPLTDYVMPLAIIFGLIVLDIAYGFYPRALERNLKIWDFSIAKDRVTIVIKNNEYRELFLEQNALHADLYENDTTEDEDIDVTGGK
ncbi:MAG: hypothetical protein ACXAEF_04665 [Candidatus Thorarchaeota archaeon]|jgi:hypothetical protein